MNACDIPCRIAATVPPFGHRCQDHDWCSSFAYNTLTKSCDLQCANATPIHAPVYAMSGPKICSLSLVLGMTLTCPWNFDYEAEKWAQVLVSGLVHAVAKIRTLGGSRANALTAQDVGVSMDKPEDSADNSRSYQLRFDVNEHLAMYLYSLLKSKSTGSKFNEYTENFTSNAAETVLKSQCRPKVSFDFVKKHVEGASFQKLAPLGQSLHLMNHSVQQYSARKAEPAEGTKIDWLLMTVGSFMAVLAIWMLPRWWVQFSKGQCVPSCDPCPEVDVRQAQVGVPLVDEVGVPLVDDEDREPSEEELRPQVMPIVQETDFLMV
ncbi:FPG1 [Symbiodinium sp. KB8]|nr:FPG1 [Symbiodinium sp. KB8]